MKRIFAFGLIMTMLLGLGFQAKAQDEGHVSVTLTWDTPGTIDPRAEMGAMDFTETTVSTTATSQTFTLDDTWGTLKIWPADGYVFEAITDSDGEPLKDGWGNELKPNSSLNPSSFTFYPKKPNGFSINMKTYDGMTLHVVVKKLERTTPLTVNVVNGLSQIKTFEFASGYAPTLKKGRNTIYYNPDVDGKIDLQFVSPTTEQEEAGYPFELSLNDEAPSELYSAAFYKYSNFNPWYQIKLDPAEDNYLYIKVFENAAEEPDTYTLTINYGEGMQGALSNIFDRTTSHMYMPEEFENGVITSIPDILDGSELRFNFLSDDYTVTQIMVNGVNKTSEIQNEGDNIQQYFTLTITENTTVTINGQATIWNDVTYTGYVSNPEGLQFGLTMDDFDLPYTVTGDCGGQTYGPLTMPEGSKVITVKVSEKNNNGRGTFYFKSKEGYFITLCYIGFPDNSETKGTQSINAAMSKDDGGSFYILVDKMDAPYTASLNVVDTGWHEVTTLKSAATYSEQNDNPARKSIEIPNGESTITFIPNYDNPFTLYFNQNQSGRVFLDGAEVSGSTNSDTNQVEYPLPLYAPEEGEGSDVHSAVDVYFTGSPSMANASVLLQNGATAEFFYSPVMHPATIEGQAVIAGTVMTVKPTSANAVVVYKGAVQTLDENGQFTFTTSTSAADNVVTVASPKSTKLNGMIPKAGSAVHSLEGVTLLIPMIIDDVEVYMDADLDILNQTVVTLNNETVATIQPISDLSELEPTTDETTGSLLLPIKFNKRLTAEGMDYYVKVPAGAFIEKTWDEATGTMVAVPGGYSSAAFNGRFDIDPSLATPIETYMLSPESGEEVGEIAEVTLSFPQIAPNSINVWEFQNATFTNGTKTIQANIQPDYTNEECTAYRIRPINDDEDFTPITEAGKWTLKVAAGTITYEGESNPEITATYTVVAQTSGYVLSPANGETTENLSQITITFPDVTEVEYNDIAITLTGPDDYSETSTDVTGTGNSRTVAFRNPTAEGEYTVTFPAGAFTLDGEESVEEVASYIFEKSWEIVPIPGATVQSLNMLTLTFPSATTVEYVGEGYMFAISAGGGYLSPAMNCVKVEDAQVPTFRITLPSTAQTPPNGLVTFSIGEGAFEIDGKESPEIRVEYTLDAPITTEYQVSPEGTIVLGQSGFDVAFIFDETSTVTIPNKSAVTMTINDEAVPASAFEIFSEMNIMMIGMYTPAYVKEGTLKINIAAGAFKVGKLDSPAISEEWTLVKEKTYEAEVSVGDGVTVGDKVGDLAKIYVTFPTATTGEVFNQYGARLNNASYGYSKNGSIKLVENEARAEGVTFEITYDPAPTETGNYYLSINGGTFLLDGLFESPAINETFIFDSKITGIENLFADENGNVTVFTLDGKVVLNNVPAAQLRELEKGMYIINGKKALVK